MRTIRTIRIIRIIRTIRTLRTTTLRTTTIRTLTIRTIRTIRIIRTRRTATSRTATRLAQRDKPALTRVSSPLTVSATTAAPEARVFLSGAFSEPTALTADLGRHLGTATIHL
jgi:hypothetical protein